MSTDDMSPLKPQPEPQTSFLREMVAAFKATKGSEQYNVFDPVRVDAVDRLNQTLSRRIESLEEECAMLRSDINETRSIKLFAAKVQELESDVARLTAERDALHSSYVKAIDALDAERRKTL